MNKIIAIHGLIGAGKDTLVSFMKAHISLYKKSQSISLYEKSQKMSVFNNAAPIFHLAIENINNHKWKCEELNIVIERFAKPLKAFIASLLGCDEEDLNSQEFKKMSLSEEYFSNMLNKIPNIREMHTHTSDALKQLYNPNIFGSTCLKRCKAHLENGADIVIINDLRYPDLEMPYCMQYGAYTVKIIRIVETNVSNKHSSEQGIPSEKFDMVIRNDGGYDDLFKNTANMLCDAGIVSYDYKKIIENIKL